VALVPAARRDAPRRATNASGDSLDMAAWNDNITRRALAVAEEPSGA
jgi:hypothetical protein